MSQPTAAILYAIFLWWLSTGLIFCAVLRGKRIMGWTMAAASLATLAALGGLFLSLEDTSAHGAFLAFSCALMVWGWHEISFLFGYVTGPRRGACPPEARGWRRFLCATEVLIHHELAIAWTAIALIWLSWDAPNQLAAHTFLLLWIMRLSAKLNLFLGVPNFSDEFLPGRLGYLRSYFAVRRMNALFPISIVAGTTVASILLWQAFNPAADPFLVVSFALLGTLAALATLEHWFLVLPVPDAALWRWMMPSKTTNVAGAPVVAPVPSEHRR